MKKIHVYSKRLMIFMDESFQEYSLIQDCEADFPQKVSLTILNEEYYINFCFLYSSYLKTIDHLNL